MHRKLPQIFNLLDEVDTIIIEQTKLDDRSIQSSSVYTIRNDNADDKNIARVTEDAEDIINTRNLTINDDNGKMVLMCEIEKINCLRNAMHIYSPSGFLLGTVKDRYFKWKADYDICTGNQNVMFLISLGSFASYLTIKMKQTNGKAVVATVSPSHWQNGEVIYRINYLKKIPVLQKMLILGQAVAYCQGLRRSRIFPNSNILWRHK
ncbi:unnamed protein product [Mytilus edulis]|uniref:Uncharacterized protein n=1 Tax=Mytilus edulis TaxID=6550 RepID=A0A8S3TDX1_MYTED|nr:unnamed protein product [Mytilus edulis]